MEAFFLEKLPLILEVPATKRDRYLKKKLELCSEIHDHRPLQESNLSSKSLMDSIKSGEASKELVQNIIRIAYKADTLEDLLRFIASKHPVTDERTQQMKDMIAANIFRSFPSPSAFCNEKRMDECESMAIFDPNLRKPLYESSWVTLKLIYELLRKIVDARLLLDEHIDDSFVVSLFSIAIVADDSREALTVTELLPLFWKQFRGKRRLIWTTVNKNLSRFVSGYRKYIPTAVKNLLSFACFRVFEFREPLEQENVEFLRQFLIPLHRTSAYPLYDESMAICLTLYLDKDTELINLMFEGILAGGKRLPSGRLCRLKLLDELKYLMSFCPIEVITEHATELLFRQIERCLLDSRQEVAVKAMEFLSWPALTELALMHEAVLHTIVMPALEKAEKHCDADIGVQAARIRQWYHEVENDAYSPSQVEEEDTDS